jgi:small conductance mechanosensitive channel
MEQYRRADLVFSISYDANIKKAKTSSILENNPKVLKIQA